MPIPFLPKMLDGLPPAVGAMLSHRNNRLGSMPRTYKCDRKAANHVHRLIKNRVSWSDLRSRPSTDRKRWRDLRVLEV